MDNQKIKELTDKIRTELGNNLNENTNQYLTEIEELTFEEPEEVKKLYEELGIAEKTAENTVKKKVIGEVKRLAELKGVKVDFKEKTEGNIFLPLDQKDKENNFSPSLIFWNLAQELTLWTIGEGKTTKSPEFWKHLEQERIWVKENLNETYQKEFELLLTPSTFPHEKLDISQILAFNDLEVSDLESEEGSVNNDFSINSQIVDKAWEIVKEKALELGTRAIIDYNQSNYIITISYASDNPNSKEILRLIIETPLKLEIELLKEQKEKLPTTENFEKLNKQNRLLENYLQDYTDEERFKEIKESIEKIK